MYRFVLLSCVLLGIQGEPLDLMTKCGRFIKSDGLHCCTKEYNVIGDQKLLTECMQLSERSSCERAICVGQKLGFASADGTVDREALVALIEKEGASEKELADAIIETCVDGDLTDFGPPDACDLNKIRQCVQLHVVVVCPEWKSDGNCSGAKESAEECVKELMN